MLATLIFHPQVSIPFWYNIESLDSCCYCLVLSQDDRSAALIRTSMLCYWMSIHCEYSSAEAYYFRRDDAAGLAGSPRSLQRQFTTQRSPLLLATSHRSLLAASHSLHKKYTFLLLCHLGNLLTMNARAFLLIFYVVRVFMRRVGGPLLGSDSLFYVQSGYLLNCSN